MGQSPCGTSHGQNWEDAPQAVLDCARANGFQPEPNANANRLACDSGCQTTAKTFGAGILTFIILKKCIGAGLLFTPAAPVGGTLILTP